MFSVVLGPRKERKKTKLTASQIVHFGLLHQVQVRPSTGKSIKASTSADQEKKEENWHNSYNNLQADHLAQ
jgi:hypothetical protein